MKQRKTTQTWCLRIVLFTLLSGVIPQAISASGNFVHEANQKRHLVWNDTYWQWTVRSPVQLPAAYADGNILFIENLSLGKDIRINIIDSYGQTVYEETIDRLSASSVMVNLDAFPEGEYTLELRNSVGGYLSGNFLIDSLE